MACNGGIGHGQLAEQGTKSPAFPCCIDAIIIKKRIEDGEDGEDCELGAGAQP